MSVDGSGNAYAARYTDGGLDGKTLDVARKEVHYHASH